MTKKEYLLSQLAKEDEQLLGLAYLYAVHYKKFGVDVTEKWATATEQTKNLYEAYKQGQIDTLNSIKEKNNMIKEDTFLVKDPIKPYHIIENTLPYQEEDKRRKSMDANTKMDGELKMNDAELRYLLEDK